jgi:hypothetical protein
VRTTNSGQIEQTLRELRRLGRLEKIDAAKVQALRSMARALDDEPGRAALWRVYLDAVQELTASGDDGGAFDEAVAAMFAEVPDAPPA